MHQDKTNGSFIIRVISLALGALLLLVAVGCAKRVTTVIPGPEEAWDKAMKLFEREKYLRAQELLKDITLNFPGSSIVDSVQFYMARCSFEMEDYLTAADEFKRTLDLYPSSSLAGAAAYYEALSYYRESPNYQLDQEVTQKAVESFQRFLEDYPKDALADSGYLYLGKCREKLATKEMAATELYFKLGEYASAVMGADYVLANYYDTPLAEAAQFLKARCFYTLQQWDRARTELQLYLDKFPKGRFAARVRQMQITAEKSAHVGAASTP
jgi:outer membrane protein assembly factor BamD